MAYEVTATRRRPRRFEDMIGQDFVVATLQKSIQAGKIAPAYLFSGPRGCGKTSSARILAKSLNCAEGPTGTPCGACPACAEITRGASLDVIEIDGASNTSVNDVRQIKDEVLFPPNSCRYKVYIIDEVHMLSTSAFNALLKTIEEPPPYVIFIFATTELHKVPATIKSRCQQFNFRLVPVDLLKNSLADAARELGIEAEDEALYWIAREATGSVRDAYTLFDQIAAFSDGHLTFDKIRDKLGLVGVDRINPLMESCVAGNASEAILRLDEILQAGVSVEQFTVDLAEYFRSLLFIKSGIRKEALLGQSPERFSATVLSSWAPVQIERALGMALQLFRDIRYSLDSRYELELTVSRLSWLGEYVSPAELRQAIGEARKALSKGASGPFPDADRRDSGEPAIRAITAGDPRDNLAEGSPALAQPSPLPAAGSQAADREPQEGLVADPFAALKVRMGMTARHAPNKEPDAGQTPAGMAEMARTEMPVDADIGQPVPVQPESVPVKPAPLPAESAADLKDTGGRGESSGSRVEFDGLQEALVTSFQSTKNMLATGLRQAFDWVETDSKVRFSVDKPFTHNFLEQEHKAIAAEASRLLGRSVDIEITVSAGGKSALTGVETAIPAAVETVRHLFRGTIL